MLVKLTLHSRDSLDHPGVTFRFMVVELRGDFGHHLIAVQVVRVTAAEERHGGSQQGDGVSTPPVAVQFWFGVHLLPQRRENCSISVRFLRRSVNVRFEVRFE
mgnify:CR=1 FL=1